jgi:hypothetical protein
MRRLYDQLDTALSNVTMLKYPLRERLRDDKEQLFPDKHLKYERTVFPTNDGPDLVEQVAAIDRCVAVLDEVRGMDLPEPVRKRVREDAGPLRYAANTLHFYDVVVRAHRHVHAGRRDQARALVGEMKRLAKKLEADTVSAAHTSSHANAPNALEASLLKPAYERLVSELSGEKAIEGSDGNGR